MRVARPMAMLNRRLIATLGPVAALWASSACDDSAYLVPIVDAGLEVDAEPGTAQPFGALEWSRTIGSAAGLDVLTDVAIAEDGGVVAAGVTLSESIGGHPVGAAGVPKNVVLKLSGRAGELSWAVVEQGLGGAMAADAAGGVVVRGADGLVRIAEGGAIDWRSDRPPGHVSALVFGDEGALYAAGYAPREAEADDPAFDLFVAEYGGDGHLVWIRRYPAAGGVTAVDLAVTAGGDLVLAGVAEGALELGSEVERAGFLARLSPSGDARWGELIAGGERTAIAGMDVDDAGSIFVGGTVGLAGTDPRRVSFLRRYGGGGQLHQETRVAVDGRLRAIVVDGEGGIVLAGTGDGGDAGGEPLPRGASFVARYRWDGAFIGQLVRADGSDYAALAAAGSAVVAAGHVDLTGTSCEDEAPDCYRYGLVDAFRMISVD